MIEAGPQRYSLGDDGEMTPDNHGNYVDYSEWQNLETERDDMRSCLEDLKDNLQSHIDSIEVALP